MIAIKIRKPSLTALTFLTPAILFLSMLGVDTNNNFFDLAFIGISTQILKSLYFSSNSLTF